MDFPHRARVVSRRVLSSRVVELTFRFEGDGFVWVPGQHVYLWPDVGAEKPMAFSIANAHGPGRSELVLAVGDGPSADIVSGAEVGFGVSVSEPQGAFRRLPAPGFLFVGVGTGVAPLRAMVQEGLASARREPMVLLAGARVLAEALWYEEFASLARAHADFDYRLTLSRPEPGFDGATGRVQDHLSAAIRGLPSGFRTYLCGSKEMVTAVRERLDGLGVGPERVLDESY